MIFATLIFFEPDWPQKLTRFKIPPKPKFTIQSLTKNQKIIVSPPPENPMEFVMISADNDVFVNKAYHEMPKMVDMMDSYP